MSKPRSPNSMLTRIENMQIGDEIFTDKSNGYISDNLNTIKRRFPGRRYTQLSVYTHEGPTFTSLKDFKKIICITRLE
ncbi:MAG: hypothetical protein ACI4V7_07355 [Succinivibrionaceae bacterium]|jgi:hypothetical protein